MKRFLLVLIFMTAALAEDHAQQYPAGHNSNEVTHRLEYVIGAQNGDLNFLETQIVNRLKNRTIVSGIEALGFENTKLVGFRTGLAVKTKGFSYAPSLLMVYNTRTGDFSPGGAIRFEDELFGGRLYTQGFVGLYYQQRPGKTSWVPIIDPLELAGKPLPGYMGGLALGVSLEKWNGERLVGLMASHNLAKGFELTVQFVPNSSFFRSCHAAVPEHGLSPSNEPWKQRALVRIGFVWKPQHSKKH